MPKLSYKFLWLALAVFLSLVKPVAAAAPKYVCKDLSTPPDYIASPARSLNHAGQVVGLAGFYADPLLVHRAFLKNYGQTMVDLGTLGGNAAEAFGINDAGQVVGEAADATGALRPFLKNPGELLQDLDPARRYHHGVAYGINQRGQMVGSVGLTSDYSAERAFLWDRGLLYDLNDLVVNLLPGQILFEATAINDRGWILAAGGGVYETSYLLIPRGGCVPIGLLLFD